MAILTGPEILNQIQNGRIIIDPVNPELLDSKSNSYDLHLSAKLLVYVAPVRQQLNRLRKRYGDHAHTLECVFKGRPNLMITVLDMKYDNEAAELTIPDTGLVLLPGVLYLGATIERTETYGFAPCIEGRSSAARLGLMTHLSAGFGDDGFAAPWTLEMTVVHPLRVYPGAPVVQISYSTLEGERRPYHGKYNGQRGPHASALWKDFLPKGVRDAAPPAPPTI